MMPRLTRLRIAGFKSFAEPVSLDILPGLTGIVGPNGCGKSNVMEALRWAMGETSAHSLRGGEMDDVIFAGTTARASRNLAEVTVTLEGASFPAPFEAESELQITRRIERGAGSVFRANGRALRARDVQTLYADLASGARSSGMVSQGRVADLVRARPEERRQVLEEAAGITGLHARRHEAELKLRAAEQNLARAGETASQMDGTRESLRRQARQAARYRTLSGLVRAAEAEHLAILHARAETTLEEARRDHLHAEAALAAALQRETEASAALAGAEATLPGLRSVASEARTGLERCRFAAETLSARAERAAREAEAAQLRVAELASDLEQAARAEQEARHAMEQRAASIEEQAARLFTLSGELDAAQTQAGLARAALLDAESRADDTARHASAAAMSARHALDVLQKAAARLATLQGRHDSLLADLAACQARRIDGERLARAASDTAAAEAALSVARGRLEAAEAARAASSDAMLPARSGSDRAAARRQAADAERGRAAAGVDRLRTALQTAQDALARHSSDRPDAETILDASHAADAAAAARAEAEAALDTAETAAAAATAEAASARRGAEDALAGRARAEDTLAAARSRAGRLATDLLAAETAWHSAGKGHDPAAIARAEALCEMSAQAFAARDEEWAASQEAHRSAQLALDRARCEQSRAEAVAARLRAEIEGLEAACGTEDGAPDLLGTLDVPDGLELAFGAAFGEALRAMPDAHTAEPGQSAWRTLPSLPPAPLPANSVALAALVTAPPALARILSHAALLDDAMDGDAAQPALAAGMVAVNRAGACWRWDGLVTPAGAPNPAAVRLALRRRMAEGRLGLEAASRDAASARQEADAAEHAAVCCGLHVASAGTARDAAETACRTAERTLEHLRRDAADAASRRSALEPSIAALRAERDAADQAFRAAEDAARTLPDAAVLDAAAGAADGHAQGTRLAVDEARAACAAARAHADGTRQVAQLLAAKAVQAEALFEAAAHARDRVARDLQDAEAARTAAEAALAILPDPAIIAAALTEAEAEDAACRASEIEARGNRQAAEMHLDRMRQAETLMRNSHAAAEAQHAALVDQVARSRADLDDAAHHAGAAEVAVRQLPDAITLEQTAAAAHCTFEAARATARQAEAAALRLEAERAQAVRVLADSRAEQPAWLHRLEEAESRHAGLAARYDAAQAAWCAAACRPGEAAAQAMQTARALDEAERTQRAADMALAAAEEQARIVSAALRDASDQALVLRDRKARLQAGCESCAAAHAAILARTAERLGSDAALPQAGDTSEPAEEQVRKRHERLCREREAMGPVNLRAELELADIDQRMAALARECDELRSASAKLRGAIGHLNREGRERLMAVFAQVDQHFRTLFTRMMGGGRAHLAMTGADDPLAAGLEVYAEPPGKKLSALSLLSGGEQALTALSLIFAVFRCTPSPLCVLDEVDAPLDDANVERFCTLLDEIVRDTGTSFLVVTHHQLTMSRMDRLFGVTMQERGVSRLLSVDLRRAVSLTVAGAMLQAAE